MLSLWSHSNQCDPKLLNGRSACSPCVCFHSFQLLQLLPTVQKHALKVNMELGVTTRTSSCYKPANCPEYNLPFGINPQPRLKWVQKMDTQKFIFIFKHQFSNGRQNFVPLRDYHNAPFYRTLLMHWHTRNNPSSEVPLSKRWLTIKLKTLSRKKMLCVFSKQAQVKN